MTWPVTLADRPEMVAALAVHRQGLDPSCRHSMVKAPCCGRRSPADTIVSLRGLKTEIRGGNHRRKEDLEWACDGCLHLLIADQSNGWTWSKLFHALGAPHEVIRHHRARELALEQERAAAGEWFNPQEAYEHAHRSLPHGMRDLPGTERPDIAGLTPITPPV